MNFVNKWLFNTNKYREYRRHGHSALIAGIASFTTLGAMLLGLPTGLLVAQLVL